MKLIQHFQKHISGKNIVAGIAFVLFVNLIAFPLFPRLFHTSLPVKNTLDLHLGFSPQTVYYTLQELSPHQRQVYLISTLAIDTPYALVYWTVYTLILLALMQKISINDKYQKLALIPLFISIFDLVENSGIVYFITAFPDINPALVPIFSIANILKWIFAAITLTITVSLLLLWLITKLKKA